MNNASRNNSQEQARHPPLLCSLTFSTDDTEDTQELSYWVRAISLLFCQEDCLISLPEPPCLFYFQCSSLPLCLSPYLPLSLPLSLQSSPILGLPHSFIHPASFKGVKGLSQEVVMQDQLRIDYAVSKLSTQKGEL